MSSDKPTCHPERSLFARSLCQSCYLRLRKTERLLEDKRRAAGLRLCRGCGHEKPLDQFHKGASRCKPCRNGEVGRYQKAHKTDPAFVEDRRRRSREWARRNRAYGRNAHLIRKFGITSEKYDSLLKKQKGVCAICGRHQPDKRRLLAVDHDHKTDRMRALLCDPCNQGLGSFSDDPQLLRKALAYLRRHRIT